MINDDKNLTQPCRNALSIANIPRGLSAALASDLRAMQVFSEMPDEPREAFIKGAMNITDKQEMRRYVKEIRKEK